MTIPYLALICYIIGAAAPLCAAAIFARREWQASKQLTTDVARLEEIAGLTHNSSRVNTVTASQFKSLEDERKDIMQQHGLKSPTYGNIHALPVMVLSSLASRSAKRHISEFVVLGIGVIASFIAGIITLPVIA